MKTGDYVRTKQRGFQYPQIAQIKSISKDSGYKNQYFIELDHNLLPDYEYRIYEEDISKSSPNIIDLIEVGDYLNGFRVNKIERDNTNTIIQIGNSTFNVLENEEIYTPSNDNNNGYEKIEKLKSIVTKEQFESMKYRIGDDNEFEESNRT